MHPEVTGHEGEKCSKCGMPLEPSSGSAADSQFSMEMKTQPTSPEAGKATVLVLRPMNVRQGNEPVPLQVEHEKKIHLILVSEDLSWFDHVHPEYQQDGSYTVEVNFPFSGSFHAYAEYRPYGQSVQTENVNIAVTGKAATAVPAKNSGLQAKSGPFSIVLTQEESGLKSNQAVHVNAVFSRDGKKYDINNLGNYLGAKAHVIAIHEETSAFLHLHPEVEGQVLHVQTVFPKPGKYRTWLQFMDGSTLRTVDFTLQVQQGTGTEGNMDDADHGHSH